MEFLHTVREAAIGAIASVALCFPCAAIMAVLYRFPVPLGGYASGLQDVPLAVMAAGFYGAVFGGFVPIGGLGGLLALRVRGKPNATRAILVQSTAIALAAAACLATLELFIGPW